MISQRVNEFIEEFITPKRDALEKVISNCGAEFSIVQYINDGCNPGLHFDKEKLKLLSQIGVDLDIDI